MKLKKIKFENIYLIIVIIQLIDWAFKSALNLNCIIYYIFVIIVYFTIKYLRKMKNKKVKEN